MEYEETTLGNNYEYYSSYSYYIEMDDGKIFPITTNANYKVSIFF